MMTRIGVGALALSAMILLGSGKTMAQDADLQAQVADTQQRYEDAIAAQDWAALEALFTENATYLPISGGMYEGSEAIRGHLEQSGLTALDATSSKSESVGENMILDFGTFTATATGEAGEMELQGEYVALVEEAEDGLRIHHLSGFPTRQPPGASAGN